MAIEEKEDKMYIATKIILWHIDKRCDSYTKHCHSDDHKNMNIMYATAKSRWTIHVRQYKLDYKCACYLTSIHC